MGRFSRGRTVSAEEVTLKPNNSYDDVLRATSEVIYENHRKQVLEGKIRTKLVFIPSVLLAASLIVIICFLNYDEYFAYINQRDDYVNSANDICGSLRFKKIDIISTPIASFLLILYALIYRRRIFLRNSFKYRNFGLPMIVSLWNKVIIYLIRKNIICLKNGKES
jgi:hypothetical protein